MPDRMPAPSQESAQPATIRLSVPAATARAADFHRRGLLADAEKIYVDILKIEPRHFDSLHLLALIRYQQGRYAEALPLFEQAQAINPESAELSSNFGLLLQRLGRHTEALAAFDKAIKLNGAYAEALANRGNLLLEFNRPDEALEAYNRALMARRGFTDALIGRGLALFNLKRFTDSLVSFDRVAASDPRYGEAVSHRTGPLYQLERYEEALASCDRAIALDPRNATAHYNRGVVLAKLGRAAEAVASYGSAIALKPDMVETLLNLGNLLDQCGRPGEALACADRIIALKPDHSRAWNNRGNALLKLERHADAMASYDKALALDPNYGECWYNYGNALVDIARVSDALGYLEKATALRPDHPDIRFNEGLARLLLGDLKRGLQSYEGRFEKTEQAPPRRTFKQPLWEGGDIAGKTILLHGEQGHGDTIQFVRYAPLLARAGATVFLEAQHALKPLLATVEGVARVFGRDAQGHSEITDIPKSKARGKRAVKEEAPAFDTHQYLISLGRIFGTELDTIPASMPYLHAPQDRLDKWRERLPPAEGLRVGLTWAGNPEVKTDVRRSIGLPRLAPLVDIPGVQFVGLHREVRPEHEAALRALPQIVHFGDELEDFADTAALIAQLDLVISTDTAVAHLAGAMGKPLWLLLMLSPDWRWLLDRDDSPWYPTAKLYRQPRFGDWSSVVARVRDDLAALAAAR